MINVLVTGANGFVGRELCHVLHADGYPVKGSVRRPGVSEQVAPYDAVVSVGEIGPDTDWVDALSEVDVVVHLAARVHMMKEEASNPLDAFRQVNALGTERLALQAAESGVKRFIYVSSIKVNGEGADKVLSENDKPNPTDPYARSKWEAEQLLSKISAQTGMEVVIVRPPLVYGPGVKANFLSLIRWVDRGVPLPLGAVKNRRSLVSVKNLVDLIIKCIDHPNAAGEVFLVADEDDISTPELLRCVAQGVGRKARLVNVPPRLLKFAFGLIKRREVIERLCGSLVVDISKAKHLLGWAPPISLAQGLSEVTQWYLQKKDNKHA